MAKKPEQETVEMVFDDSEELNKEFNQDIEELDSETLTETQIFVQDTDGEGFLPEIAEDEMSAAEESPAANDTIAEEIAGTELEEFEAAEIEELEFVEDERLESIIESILFASDRPVSLASIKLIFKGTNVTNAKIKRTLDNLMVEFAGGRRGVMLEETTGGFQLRTKLDNMEFLKRSVKARPFKLSGPALEVLAITAYKQPVVKYEVDEIRGVESGHLLRALMEKNLVAFAGKSELPGKPMQYGTTRKFLEIFGLRNLKELPTLSQIDELLPEGITEDDVQKPKLADITDSLSEKVMGHYSESEEELNKITDQLQSIQTSSEFFEQEKQRQREQKDKDKAQNIRDALTVGEEVSTRDLNWLKKYDEMLAAGLNPSAETPAAVTVADESEELAKAVAAFDNETDAQEQAQEIEEYHADNDVADIEGNDIDDGKLDNEVNS